MTKNGSGPSSNLLALMAFVLFGAGVGLGGLGVKAVTDKARRELEVEVDQMQRKLEYSESFRQDERARNATQLTMLHSFDKGEAGVVSETLARGAGGFLGGDQEKSHHLGLLAYGKAHGYLSLSLHTPGTLDTLGKLAVTHGTSQALIQRYTNLGYDGGLRVKGMRMEWFDPEQPNRLRRDRVVVVPAYDIEVEPEPYVVKKNDTMSAIAIMQLRKLGMEDPNARDAANFQPLIYLANEMKRNIISSDPDKLQAGVKLWLPAEFYELPSKLE